MKTDEEEINGGKYKIILTRKRWRKTEKARWRK